MEDSIKFIITGQGRCGSNLLKFALKQHPKCQLIGEYYNKNVYSDVFESDGNKRAEKFFSSIKPNKTAIGFKIFIHQATRKPAKSVWRYLSNPQNNVHVIHLIRANRFERILSLNVARMSGAWKYSEDKLQEYMSVQINNPPQWWEKEFADDKENDSKITSLFSGLPYLCIKYEDLIINWGQSIGNVQDFLQLKRRPLQKTLKKQELFKKSERVENYIELKKYFSNTEYAWMFTD